MAIISVKNIKQGMILSANVVHANGRVLLTAGSELRENHINIFKTWGILSLNIQSKDDELIKTKKNHSSEEIKQFIDKKKMEFQYCDLNHPFMEKLFRISIKMSLEQEDEKNR